MGIPIGEGDLLKFDTTFETLDRGIYYFGGDLKILGPLASVQYTSLEEKGLKDKSQCVSVG